jgi:SAM-dependent methyltransferase
VRAPEKLAELIGSIEPEVLQQIIAQYLEGEISAAIAITRLLIHMQDAERVEGLVRVIAEHTSALPPTSGAHQRGAEMRRLFGENRDGCLRIAHILRGGMDFSGPARSLEEGIADCAQLFERAVRQSEEASVALYSLGSPQLLNAATAEVIALLDAWGLLGPQSSILQIGCGIGRFEAALAGRVKEAYGIDISPAMVEAARHRCQELDNVHIQACSGRDLALFSAGTFDLVYAVDTFPCLYPSGWELVARYFAEVARVLKPRGDFAIFNFTYRGSAEADRADVQSFSRRYGFEVVVNGSYPFQLWDASAWWLRTMPR